MNTINTYEQDTSAMGRVRIWEASWKIALERPLTGGGFRAPYYQEIINRFAPGVTARAVHSIYFETLGEHGFPAFFVWLGMTLAGAYYAWRLMHLTRGRPDLAWAGDLGRMVQVSIVAYLCGGAFLSLSYWDFYWMVLIVVGSAHSLVRRTLAETQPEAPAAGAVIETRRPPVPAGAMARSR